MYKQKYKQIKNVMKKIVVISFSENSVPTMLLCVAINSPAKEYIEIYNSIINKQENMIDLICAHLYHPQQEEEVRNFLTEVLVSKLSSIQWVAIAPVSVDIHMKCDYCIEPYLANSFVSNTVAYMEKAANDAYVYLPYVPK